MHRSERPIRDESGRFVTGHKSLIRPTYLFSHFYPKLFCNTCYFGRKCPEYHKGYVCAYKRVFKKYNTRKINDIINLINGDLNKNLAYMDMLITQEILSGGGVDPVLTRLITINANKLLLLYRLLEQVENGKGVKSPISQRTLDQLVNQVTERNSLF